MGTNTLELPDMFLEWDCKDASAPELTTDVLREVENQLKRKFFQQFGSKLSLAAGEDLYANSLQGVKHVHTVKHTKEGKASKNPHIHGFAFEAQEVFATNREGIIDGSGVTANTTDELGATNHQHVDVMVFDKAGKVIETQQLKHVKGAYCLYEEAYTTHPDAPDRIVVPADKFEEFKGKLGRVAERAKDPAVRERAQVALQKLQAGKTQAGDSFSPYTAIAKQTASDAATRVGEKVGQGILYQVGGMAVGGAIWELKDAMAHPGASTLWERVKRLFMTLFGKLHECAVVRTTREASLEAFTMILGVLKNSFKSFGAFLTMLGKSANNVWESLCDYFSGKISSFSELVAIIAKGLVTVGIGSLAILLEQKLSVLGVPTLLGGLMAAALAGVTIALINKGIDAIVFALVSAFSSVAAAKSRREEIAAVCAEMIPQLVADRENFQKLVDAYYAKRTATLSAAFSQLHATHAVQDVQAILCSLESINQAFGTTLGWKTQEEFDSMMLDDTYVFKM